MIILSLQNANKTLSPKWHEQFELHMFPEQPKMLEVTVWDRDIHTKDDIMGRYGNPVFDFIDETAKNVHVHGPRCRCVIDLSKLQPEATHRLWQDLEDGAGSLHLLITITATIGSESVSNVDNFNIAEETRAEIANAYVGYLLFPYI